MVCKINQKGFSLIELLVTLAILAIIMAISALNYVPATRGFRTKKAVQEIKSVFQDARAIASKESFPVMIIFDGDSQSFDIFLDKDNETDFDPGEDYFYRITLSEDQIDPGKPASILKNYYFEPYVIAENTTREGLTEIDFEGGLGSELVGTTNVDINSVPFVDLNNDFKVLVDSSGFFHISIGGISRNYAAFVCMHQHDKEEAILHERQYAIIILKTGLISSYRLDTDSAGDSSWELF